MKRAENLGLKEEYDLVGEVLLKEEAFLLTSHINPDGDSIGSLAALARLLAGLDREHLIFLHGEAPERYRFLLEGLPLTRDPAAAENRVILALDCSDPARLGRLEAKARDTAACPLLVNMDHHVSNTGYGSLNLVDPEAAATGEIIYHLARLLKAKITPEMAIALYTALSTDTGSFKYDNTTAGTFRIMADLLETGFPLRQVSRKVFDEISPAALCLLREGLNALEFDPGGKIAWITVTDTALTSCGAGEEHLDGLVNYAANVRGVNVGLLFRAKEGGEVKAGFRSREVDVREIAASLGGGGHKKAAGCTLEGPLEDVKALVLQRVAAKVYKKVQAPE